MGVKDAVEQELKQAKEAVDEALLHARHFAVDEIIQPLKEAAGKLDAINNRVDGTVDRFIHEVERSRYTALILTGLTVTVWVSGMIFGWFGHAIFN